MKKIKTVERLAANPHYNLSPAQQRELSETQNSAINAAPKRASKRSKKSDTPAVDFIEPVLNRNRVVRETGAIKKHTTIVEE